MRHLKVVVLVLATSLVAASSADAAQRFVATTGSGTTCTQAVPCTIVTGINNAASGDEVIIAPGTYTTATDLTTSLAANIHGTVGQPRPVINSSANNALSVTTANAQVRDLAIRHSGLFNGLFVLVTTGQVERVDVQSSGSVACNVGLDVVFRDSLCVNSNSSGNAFRRDYSGGTTTAKLRNDTFIAPGATARGMLVSGASGGANLVDARNVITMGGLQDATATTTGSTSFAVITFANSNYDTSVAAGMGATITAPGAGTNQTVPPLFADTTGYHQAAGSPTINAGTTDPDLGTADLDGDARTVGSAPDIGADEFVPVVVPPDTTPPQTTIDNGPRSKTKSKKATFNFSSSEAGSTFTCALDRAAATSCTSPLKLKRLGKGKHTLTVTATDAAGNADATPATYKWKVKSKHRRR